MIELALVPRLSTLCPNLFPLKAPKGFSTPCVIYERLKTDPFRDLGDGAGEVSAYVIRLDVYDPGFIAAKTLAHVIRDNLVAWSDDDVQSVAFIDETDLTDEATEVMLYRTMISFLIIA